MSLLGRRLLIVGINYAPEVTGIAPYTTAMARHFAGLGADVHVVTGVPHYPGWRVAEDYKLGSVWTEWDGNIRLTRVRHAVPKQPSLAGRALLEASFAVAAGPHVFTSNCEAVIAVTPSVSAAAVARWNGVMKKRPLGIIVQDLTGNAASESGTTSSRIGRAIGGVEYGLLRHADLLGVVDPRFGEIATGHGVAPDRIVEVPNFVHIEKSGLSMADARRDLGWPLNRFIVLHTGNMGMKQGLETVIEAAVLADMKAPGMDFFFVGGGNQRSHLETLATGMKNVRFVDVLPENLYPHALAAADVLLLNERPSVREMSLPSKLTSYLAAGRPIVAAVAPDGTAARLAEKSGSCLIVAGGHPADLLEALTRLSADTELSSKLASSGVEYAVEHLSSAATLDRYEEFAARLLAMTAAA